MQSIEIAARWAEKLEASARATAERSALRKANARAEAAVLRAQQQQQFQEIYRLQQLQRQQQLELQQQHQQLQQSQGGGLASMSPAVALPGQSALHPMPFQQFTTQQQLLLEQQQQKHLLKQQRRALKANAAAVERAEFERVRARVMADPVVAEAVRVYGLTNDASKLGAAGLLKMAELVKEKQAEMMALRAREIEQQQQQQLGAVAAATSDPALQPAHAIADGAAPTDVVPQQATATSSMAVALDVAVSEQGQPMQQQPPHCAGLPDSHRLPEEVPMQSSSLVMAATASDDMNVDQSVSSAEAT